MLPPSSLTDPDVTDVNDAMWLPELLAHGLIRASFVPDAQTQEMRNLLRTRKQLVREQSSHVLRVQKTLEDANIKLDSVLSDVMGKSGRAMIEAGSVRSFVYGISVTGGFGFCPSRVWHQRHGRPVCLAAPSGQAPKPDRARRRRGA